jgi:hypothetical protein
MEFKLTKEIPFYEKGNLTNINTLIIDDEKLDSAKLQRQLATIFNGASLKLLKSLNTDDTKNNDNVANKEEVSYDDATYRATGFNLYPLLNENEDIKILKLLFNNGCLYFKEHDDLKDNDKAIDTIDIKDIYLLLGYYFLNFTTKQLV